MTITFIGHGYVGLVTATVFADLGNNVHVIGHTDEKIQKLKKGIIPIYEPGLEEMVKRNVDAGRLHFTLDYKPAIPDSDVVFIAVGTPPMPNGEADLSVVFHVAEELGKYLKQYTVVIVKSTVPVGTNFKVEELIKRVKPSGAKFDVASVPEFLREGQAINDTLHPNRIVIGTESTKARNMLVELHQSIDGERVLTNVKTAEMIKYASNGFLATKISFANAIAQLCELTGASGPDVLEAMGMDSRIGSQFLSAGAAYGGSCFPKDVKALIAIAQQHGYNFKLLKEVEAINKDAKELMVTKAKKQLGNVKGKTVAILGLAFKPDTDDMRDAPSIYVIKRLLEEGARVKAYDPIATSNAKSILGSERVLFTDSPYEAAKDADVLILMTEWNEFREMDMERVKSMMASPKFIDGRNVYDPEKMKALGFTYVGVGR